MIVIAHRGNLNGPNPELENSPDYLRKAVYEHDCLVEYDLWVDNDDQFWLGHDKPQYKTDWKFIREMDEWAYVHCKNHQALSTLLADLKYGQFFYHENDPFTLIYGHRWIWAYPSLTNGYDERTIMAMPEMVGIENRTQLKGPILGVCTDYPIRWKESL